MSDNNKPHPQGCPCSTCVKGRKLGWIIPIVGVIVIVIIVWKAFNP